MGATINIDTGGTFTDGFFTHGEVQASVKVDTTPHDLTECLARCVDEGAGALGFPDTQALLRETDVFRFSSTIGTNTLIQQRGPRVGLLVDKGAANTLYGQGESSLYEFVLRKDLVAEIKDATDGAEVRDAVRRLLVGGARLLVVSFAGSDTDPSRERSVKQIVQQDYPRHYLGSVPCLLASEVTPRPGAERRTATAVLNAYLHPEMVKTLYQADEDVRANGYAHPLLVSQSSGALARVAKTTAISTYNSGPSAGVYGAARLAARYGLEHVATMDIGGTSTDVALISGGRVPMDVAPSVHGIPVALPMVHVDNVGGGGGSLVRRTREGYSAGPDSAGAVPGPACYGLGGTQPTVTDADVVLGYIDPDNFLGGRRRLDQARARDAIGTIAGDERLEDAAYQVHRALAQLAADRVAASVRDVDGDPATFALIAFGGGGGLYAADVARLCGIPRAYHFRDSSVFSAVGLSTIGLGHVYEVQVTDSVLDDVEQLIHRARLDVTGEGHNPDQLRFTLELDEPTRRETLSGDPAEAARPILADAVAGSVARLHTVVPTQVPELSPITPGSAGASSASRTIWHESGAVEAPAFQRSELSPGTNVAGPAVVEASDTTILIPGDAEMTIDELGTAVMEVS